MQFLCCSPSQFLVVTGHALQLESLHTGLSCWVSTRLLSHLLRWQIFPLNYPNKLFLVRLNPLEHMRSLRIDNTADLSAPALFLLLQRATNLEEVIGTETWQELDLRTCADLTDLFDRHHLPHRCLITLVCFLPDPSFHSGLSPSLLPHLWAKDSSSFTYILY